MVEDGFTSDFATTEEANKLVMFKKAIKDQNRMNMHITKFVRLYIKYNVAIIDRMRTSVGDNMSEVKAFVPKEAIKGMLPDGIVDVVLDLLVNKLNGRLPTVKQHDTQTAEAYVEYSEILDQVLNDVYISPDTLGPLYSDALQGDEIGLDDIKLGIKSFFLRQWMANNDFLPELAMLDQSDEKKATLLGRSIEDYDSGVKTLIQSYAEAITKRTEKLNKQREEIDEIDDPETTPPDATPIEVTGDPATIDQPDPIDDV